jgi:hypothetical protein
MDVVESVNVDGETEPPNKVQRFCSALIVWNLPIVLFPVALISIFIGLHFGCKPLAWFTLVYTRGLLFIALLLLLRSSWVRKKWLPILSYWTVSAFVIQLGAGVILGAIDRAEANIGRPVRLLEKQNVAKPVEKSK